jgi:hypothetical protein
MTQAGDVAGCAVVPVTGDVCGLSQIPNQLAHRGSWEPNGQLEPGVQPAFADVHQFGSDLETGAVADPAEHLLANLLVKPISAMLLAHCSAREKLVADPKETSRKGQRRSARANSRSAGDFPGIRTADKRAYKRSCNIEGEERGGGTWQKNASANVVVRRAPKGFKGVADFSRWVRNLFASSFSLEFSWCIFFRDSLYFPRSRLLPTC